MRYGGIIHTYQKYDPRKFPSPVSPPSDLVDSAFEHLLTYGGFRELTEAELAKAIRIDPSQIKGFGPSIDALLAILMERRRKLLETYETDHVIELARRGYDRAAAAAKPPRSRRKAFQQAVAEEQIIDFERLWFGVGSDTAPFARQLLQVIERLGEKYIIEELAATYRFTGRTPLTVARAIALKEELDKIAELIEQLLKARETAQIALVDLEALSEFVEPQEMAGFAGLARQIEDYVREMAERQGLQHDGRGYRLTPKAYRIFQGGLLERIFSQLEAGRSGRHANPIEGDGAVEMTATKAYEFGDSLAHVDMPASITNALARDGAAAGMRCEDLEIHKTRNTPKCGTVVIMDMSGSMRHGGQYVHVKRMALALDGLIRKDFPGDYLGFVEMSTFAKLKRPGEIIELMPKPVTIFDPWVRLKVDMSRNDISETQIHPHFTNIQHGLNLGRRLLTSQNARNRQIILITDGLPTAHFEESWLHLLYPPDPLTERATMREALLCQHDGITINVFLVPSWSQSEEDIRFAHRLAESTKGRVFFTAGKDLDRYVVWDYVRRKREIIA